MKCKNKLLKVSWFPQQMSVSLDKKKRFRRNRLAPELTKYSIEKVFPIIKKKTLK